MYSNGELAPDSAEAKLFDRLAQALIGVEPDKFPSQDYAVDLPPLPYSTLNLPS